MTCWVFNIFNKQFNHLFLMWLSIEQCMHHCCVIACRCILYLHAQYVRIMHRLTLKCLGNCETGQTVSVCQSHPYYGAHVTDITHSRYGAHITDISIYGHKGTMTDTEISKYGHISMPICGHVLMTWGICSRISIYGPHHLGVRSLPALRWLFPW